MQFRRLLVLTFLLVAALSVFPAVHDASGQTPPGPAPQRPTEPPPSGALVPAPINADFSKAAPAQSVKRGTATQPDEESVPGWKVTNGRAKVAREGDKSSAVLDEEEASLVSSTFTLGADSQAFNFDYRFLTPADKSSGLQVFARTGVLYAEETLLTELRCPCKDGWQTARVNVSKWAGENIEIKFVRPKGATGEVRVRDVATDLKQKKLQNSRAAKAADPVDTSTGYFNLSMTDVAIPGKGIPLNFTRTYNSNSSYSGSLGYGWSHTYSMGVVTEADDSRTVRYPDGRTANFTVVPSVTFDAASSGDNWTHYGAAGANKLLLGVLYYAGMYGQCHLMLPAGWTYLNEYAFESYWRLALLAKDGYSGGFAQIGVTVGDPYDPEYVCTYGPSFYAIAMSFSGVTGVKVDRSPIPSSPFNLVASFSSPTGSDGTQRAAAGSIFAAYTKPGASPTQTISGQVVVDLEGATQPATFKSPTGNYDTLVRNADGTYTLTSKGQIKAYFDSTGKLTSLKDRNNNTTTVAYNGSGFISSATDPGGRSLTFTTNGSGRITQITDPLSRTVTFAYDGSAHLTSATDATGTETYAYTGNLMTSWQDRLSRTRSNVYDNANRVVKQTDALNAKTCFYYYYPYTTSADCPGVSPVPQSGQTVMVDPRASKTTYSFDTNFNTTSVKDHFGNVATRNFDTNWNVTCITNELGNKTQFLYDTKGNVTTVYDSLQSGVCASPSGQASTFTYTALNDVDLATDKLGRKTDYVYDASGNLTATLAQDASSVTKARACLTIGASGLVTEAIASTTLTDCTGNKAKFEYDTKGNVTATVDPRFSNQGAPNCASGTQTLWAPSATPQYADWNDTTPLELGTKFSSDVDGYVCGVRFYKGVGNTGTHIGKLWTSGGTLLASATFTGETSTGWQQVNFGAPVQITANTSYVVSYSDPNGHFALNFNYFLSTGVDNPPLHAPSSGNGAYVFGPGNFPSQSVSNNYWVDVVFAAAPTPKDTFTYDLGGRLLTAQNELSHTTTNTYDARNRPLTVKDHLNNTTTYTYDAVGNLKTVTDALAKVTTYNYNAENRLTSVVDAANGTTTYVYDANGNRTSVTNARGKTSTATYDALNRLLTGTDALNRTTTIQYDAASRVTQRTDARGLVTQYFYDVLGRTTRVEHRTGGVLTDQVTYTYDAVGNRTQMVDTTGTTTYVYDALDRLTSVTSPGPKTVTYAYDNVGRLSTLTYPSALQVTYGYDAANNMTSAVWSGNTATYAYNNVGALTTATLPASTGIVGNYTYDNADRLTGINWVKGGNTISSATYTLNAVSLRTQMVDQLGTHSYSYDNLRRLTGVTYAGPPQTDNYTYDAVGNRLTKNATGYTYDDADQMTVAGGVNYTYDNNGNQTGRGADTFQWDHENRLKQATIAGATSTYTYNGDGLRQSKTVGGATTNYTWAGSNVLDDGTNKYVYGLGLLATINGATTKYRLSDGLGSTTREVDSTGTVIGTYNYDVFGTIRSQTGSGGEPFLFAGEQRDAESGYTYLRARYYDPVTGRFISKDPLGGGYPYAGNNPVNLTDPSGLHACSGDCSDWDCTGDCEDCSGTCPGNSSSGSGGGYAAPDPAQFATHEAYLMAYAGVQALNRGGGDSSYMKNTLRPIIAFLLESSNPADNDQGGLDLVFAHNNRGSADFIALITNLRVTEGNSWHIRLPKIPVFSVLTAAPKGGLSKPILGAIIITLVDAPEVVAIVACTATGTLGACLPAIELYTFTVALPGTAFGICLIANEC